MISFKEFLLLEGFSGIQNNFMVYIRDNIDEFFPEKEIKYDHTILIKMLEGFIKEKLSDNDLYELSSDELNSEIEKNLKNNKFSYGNLKEKNVNISGKAFPEIPTTFQDYRFISFIEKDELSFLVSRKFTESKEYSKELERNIIPDIFYEINKIYPDIKLIDNPEEPNHSFLFTFEIIDTNRFFDYMTFFSKIQNKLILNSFFIAHLKDFKTKPLLIPELKFDYLTIRDSEGLYPKLFNNPVFVENIFYLTNIQLNTLQNFQTSHLIIVNSDVNILKSENITNLDLRESNVNILKIKDMSNLDLRNSRIESPLPKDLHLTNLKLSKGSFLNLSDGLMVNKKLDLRGSTITKIGKRTSINGDIILNNLITELPPDLKCDTLDLTWLKKPITLPPSLKVKHIKINENMNFEIPDSLKSKILHNKKTGTMRD